MSVIHVNRRGTKYYLHTGPRRGGGIQHFFSTKPEGQLAGAIPDGFEIQETVNAAVYLRRKQPKLIREDELDELRQRLKAIKGKRRYCVEARGKVVTIHESTSDFSSLAAAWSFVSPQKVAEVNERFTDYQAVMRFVLADAKTRQFSPERYCFRGSVEDWISIGPPDTLAKLAEKYFKHLGKDSIYELF